MSATLHFDVYQGSEEWRALRCGILTASEMHKIITPSNLKPANNDKCRAHFYEILAQRDYISPVKMVNNMMVIAGDALTAYRGK